MFPVFLAKKVTEALEFLGLKAHPAQWDQWALLVCRANPELVSLVPPVILENLASLVCQEEMVLPDQWDSKGQRVTLVLQALDHQENQVKVVHQVCLDLWGQKDTRDLLVSQALPAYQVWENQVNPESQETEDHLVLQEALVRKESQGQLDLLVCRVLLALLAQLAHRVLEDSKVSQAQLDPKATLAWQVHQVKEE